MKTSSLKMIAVIASVASLLGGDVAFAKGGSGSGSHSGGSSHSSSHSSGSNKSSGVKTGSSNTSKSNSGNKTGSSKKTTSTGNNKTGSNKTSSTNGNKTGKTNSGKTASTNGSKNNSSKVGKQSKSDSGKTANSGNKNNSGKHDHHDKHDNHDKRSHHDKSCFSDHCWSNYGYNYGYCYPSYSCYSPIYCEPSYVEVPCCEQVGVEVVPVAPLGVEQLSVVGQPSEEVEVSVGDSNSPATDTTAPGSDEDVARTAVPAGSTLLVDGQEFGSKPGSAQLRIGAGTMKVAIVEWTANSVKVSLPKADQAGSANVDLEIVRADGSIASRTSLEVNSTDEVASNN
jgi:hypothetical protein